VTPFDAIKAQGKDVRYSIGAMAYRTIPLLSHLVVAENGEPGFMIKFYPEPPSKSDRKPFDERHLDNSFIFLGDYKNPAIEGVLFYADIEAFLTPEEDGEYQFGLMVLGTAKLYVDGELVVDNQTKQRLGDSFFGAGTVEEIGSIELKAGRTYKILVQFGTAPTSTVMTPEAMMMGAGGLTIGGARKINPEKEIEKAVQLAKSVDQVVICAGLNVSSPITS